MDKRFVAILVAIIIVFVGVFAITQHNSNPSGATANNAQPTNHVEGQGSTGVKLVEYGDYECPVCGAYYQPVKQAVSQLSSQIYFQFRNLPLSQIHPNAFAGARAAEAASLQGKFWQMHDLLYQNQDPSGQSGWVASSNPLDNFFVGFANQLGLNINKFKSDYGSNQVNDKINADVTAFLDTSYAGHDTNKEATPTYFLDGKYIDNTKLIDSSTGQPSAAKFIAAINAEIAAKK